MQHNSQPIENQSITKQHVFNLLNPVIRGNLHKSTNSIIDIIHCTTSDDSLQGRPRGGDRHRVAPEGVAGSRMERNSDVEVLHCGLIEMLGSLLALCDYRPTLNTPNVRGRRLALGTTALMSPPMHRRTVLRRIS